jgi:hypothetical protein
VCVCVGGGGGRVPDWRWHGERGGGGGGVRRVLKHDGGVGSAMRRWGRRRVASRWLLSAVVRVPPERRAGLEGVVLWRRRRGGRARGTLTLWWLHEVEKRG